MRNAVLALSLVVSTGACVHRPIHVENAFEVSSPSPLAVRLLPPAGGMLRFLASEPSYVAIFEVVPDLGISMLYPRFADARASSAGLNTTFMPSHVEGRWYYADAQYYSAASTFSKPTYLYIIASRSPLPVHEMLVSPASLRAKLGWRSFLANDLSGTLDDLERLVAGSLPEDDWSSDLHVIWPDVQSDRPWQTQYAFLPCDDGRMILVPVSWNVPVCPGARNLAQATKPVTPPATPPGTIPDSDSTETPEIPGRAGGGPHRPVPPRAVDAMPGDSPRSWLRAEHARRPGGAPDRLDRAERVERSAPVAEQRRAPESRPAPGPAPRQEPPRSEPQPRPEPPRSTPASSPPAPREPVEPTPAGKP